MTKSKLYKPPCKSIVLRHKSNLALEMFGGNFTVKIVYRKGKKYPVAVIKFVFTEMVEGLSIDGLYSKFCSQHECEN